MPQDKLLFIGMADTAGYWWCAMESLFKNKNAELGFFGAYLEDRIDYSKRLGRIKTLPEKPEELLKIGDDITLSDIEKLLPQKVEGTKGIIGTKEIMQYITPEDEDIFGDIMFKDIISSNGRRVRIFTPYLDKGKIREWEEKAKSEGIEIGNIEDYPEIRGEFAHKMRAGQYPSIRWNFKWQNYIIVGVPDGITRDFVYEFKSCKNKFIFYYKKGVALTQSDFYGYFFNRPRKKVEIEIEEDGSVETFDEPVDKENVIRTLDAFKKMDEGEIPKAPKEWKCKKCDFRMSCCLF